MPKVSVIMPVYNVASYLDAAFISLQQQTNSKVRNISC